MVNNIRIGINQVLDSHFPGVSIYGEEIKQGFEEPCFFVKVLSDAISKEFNRRYRKDVFFDIHYFSNKEKVNEDCHDIAERLYEALDYIQVGSSLLRSKNKRYEIVDRVLHFFLEFDTHMFKAQPQVPYMQTLKEEAKIRNG
ncbi:phage tail terminator family protein [Geosporobacter ferrireducens]|uniref:phage tail terminator family protein n=1 Tax=Geosporobacter ferrireducens TaxID=1424294 RepID=UPI00139B843A|nr:hypothetical protein [Geosporobacter ferrireducens]MTI56155.1 hypothetical protein [Geosporobacter ferrireducens]